MMLCVCCYSVSIFAVVLVNSLLERQSAMVIVSVYTSDRNRSQKGGRINGKGHLVLQIDI